MNMTMTAICDQCGRSHQSNAIGGSGAFVVKIIGSGASCPFCGGFARFTDGVYEFVGDVLKAFRAAGVDPGQVVRFGEIVQEVASGKATHNEVSQAIENLGPSFAKLWAMIGTPQYANIAATATLLTTLVALWLAQIAQDSPAAHRKKLEAEVSEIYKKLQNDEAFDELIADALAKRNATRVNVSTGQFTTSLKQDRPNPEYRGKNRRERRSAAAQERKK